MAAGSVILLGASGVLGETPAAPAQVSTWAARSYLILIRFCAVFVLYLYVPKRWTASATAYSFVLFPFVTVAAAAWLAGEGVLSVFLWAGVLVLEGVYVGAITSQTSGREPSPTVPAEDGFATADYLATTAAGWVTSPV